MKILRNLFVVLLVGSSALPLNAVTLVWNATGNSNNRWYTSSNWNPVQLPNTGDTLIFPNASVNTTTVPDAGDTEFVEIRFLKPGYILSSTGGARVDARTVSVLHTDQGTQLGCDFYARYGATVINVPNSGAFLGFYGNFVIATTAGVTFQGAGQIEVDNLTTGTTSATTMTKTGSGLLLLNNTNTANNLTINVNQGILQINQTTSNTGAVNYTNNNAGGTLIGVGRTGTGPVTNRGLLYPGTTTTPGTLTIDGPLICPALQNGYSTVGFRLGGTGAGQSDVLACNGQVDLSGATLGLGFVNGYNPPIGASFTLIARNSSNVGPATAYGPFPEGSTVVFQSRYFFSITYRGNPYQNQTVLTRIATPAPRILNPAYSPAKVFSATVSGQPSTVARVESSNDLQTWSQITTLTLGASGTSTSGTATFSQTNANPRGFYRVSAVEP